MRQHRRAGEKMFIDYAGSMVALSDGARAQIFVSAMAASSCVFACATPTQRLDDWIEGIVGHRTSIKVCRVNRELAIRAVISRIE